MIDRHSQSTMHKEAMDIDITRRSVEHHGGIQQAFQWQISVQRKALVGAFKIIYYCLAKEELPLTTKYAPLLDLAMHLGCDYLRLGAIPTIGAK